MLKRTEGGGNQGKCFPEGEVTHIALNQGDLILHFVGFVFQFLPANLQHMSGKIQPGDGDIGPGRRNQNPSSSAADLKNGSAGFLGKINKKFHIRSIPVGDDLIV